MGNHPPIPQKKLYLHIGTHKTGTTALQVFLSKNDRRLQDTGFLFPKSGRIGTFSGQHNIAWELNGDPCFDKALGNLAELSQEISSSGCHNICLSSEDFEYLYRKPESLQHLKETLEPEALKHITSQEGSA